MCYKQNNIKVCYIATERNKWNQNRRIEKKLVESYKCLDAMKRRTKFCINPPIICLYFIYISGYIEGTQCTLYNTNRYFKGYCVFTYLCGRSQNNSMLLLQNEFSRALNIADSKSCTHMFIPLNTYSYTCTLIFVLALT